jgi:hypothetical protein
MGDARQGHLPRIRRGRERHVLAYFTGREEDEVVVIPDRVLNMRIERIAVPDPKPTKTVKLTDIVTSIAAKP